MKVELEAIRKGLQKLASVPIPEVDLCAKSHRYVLNPPLTEKEVRAFEAAHGIALPTDYRDFLINVGNGGAGPEYGIFKLGETDVGRGFAPWDEDDGFVGTLSAPFPHTGPWNDASGRPEHEEADEEY